MQSKARNRESTSVMQLDPCYVAISRYHHKRLALVIYTPSPRLTAARPSHSIAISMSLRFVTHSSLLFTARNASVKAKTMAAVEESPEPTATVPEAIAKPLPPGNYKTLQGIKKSLLRTRYTGFMLSLTFGDMPYLLRSPIIWYPPTLY